MAGTISATTAMYMAMAASAVSALARGKQASDANKAASRAEEYNAAVARNKAENTRAVYGQKAEQQSRSARLQLGQQRAAGAEMGVGMGGSIADMEHQSMVNAEMDSLNIQYQGKLESQGLLSQASMSDYNAYGYKTAASNSMINGYLGAGSALLSGVAKSYKTTPETPPKPAMVTPKVDA